MAESLKSDEFFDNSCTKCDRKHRNTEATWYCPNCDEYFCDACKKLHDEFTRNHAVLDNTKAELWGVATKEDIEQCPDHPGQAVTMFCGQHDTVCCPVCSALQHSSCEAKAFIQDLVNDGHNTQKSEALLDDISSMKAKMFALKEVLNDNRSSLDDSRTNANLTIDGYQEEAQTALAIQITTANEKMEAINRRRDEEIASDMDTCDTLSASLRDMLMKLAETKNRADQTNLFIDMKYACEMDLQCRDKLNRMQQFANYDIKWSEDKTKLECIETATDIGHIEQNPAPGQSRPIERLDNYQLINIRSKHDKKACDIQGMCQLVDGTIILSDNYNTNLKRLDSDYRVTEVCGLQCPPGDMCTTGRKEIAVALGSKRQIMFVSVTDKMRVMQILTVDLKCYKIAFHDGILYIVNAWDYCISYDIKNHNNEIVITKLNVLDPCPASWGITTSRNGEYIYMVGGPEELYIYDRSLSNMMTVKHPHFAGSTAGKCICVDTNGNVFVSVRVKNIVATFKKHGFEENGKLDTSDKLEDPHVLLVDNVKSKLIVSKRFCIRGGVDTIFVWDIVHSK